MYDELVKALRGCVLSKPCDGCPYYDPNGPTKKCATMNIAAADAIEELICELADEHNARLDAEERQCWIPVSERLPEEYVNVLCHLRSLDRKSEYYSIDHLMEDGQWWKAANSWKYEVTHWMPLPEPPEEGE